jgi:hypothetical protein
LTDDVQPGWYAVMGSNGNLVDCIKSVDGKWHLEGKVYSTWPYGVGSLKLGPRIDECMRAHKAMYTLLDTFETLGRSRVITAAPGRWYVLTAELREWLEEHEKIEEWGC